MIQYLPYKNDRTESPPRDARYRGLCECDAHAWAVLTKGYVTFVSPEDAELLASRKWCAMQCDRSVYVAAGSSVRGKFRLLSLHREILGNPPFHIGHRDCDELKSRSIRLSRSLP